MVDKRNKNRTFVVSLLVTLSIISILIALVPANAVTVSIDGLSGSIMQGTPKTFMVTVTMESPDKFVPVSNITLRLNGPTTKQWTFDPVHGMLIDPSDDKNITIKVISPPSTEQFGYGYGNFGYGYGYGYGYGAGGGSISFIYQVTLSTTDLTPGNYTATAALNTANPAKANFASPSTSFTVVPQNK